ncbi:MAG: sugar phosphate nucleotidyltransferase [Nanoarchaeota archaeon]
MKVIIPMAGKGKRYNEVYFNTPKPLIEIDGKPMIEHVVNLFSPEDEFIFICNETDLEKTNLRQVLQGISPNGKIIAVSFEKIRYGPVYSCAEAFDLINDDEEVIVNYCDFTQKWDYKNFLHTVRTKRCDGAIPSFRGFHPASLGDTYYAYMKIDENNYVTELREKESFSENRMEDFSSTGTYYFKKGALLKEYAKRVIETGFNVKGEAYLTLPFILMLRDGLKILNYEVNKFICWGTPRDYEIYKFWSEFFFSCSGQVVGFNNVNIKTTNIFPLAGDERTFISLGMNLPDFLIPVMNQPLISLTVNSHPKGINNIFLYLEKHKEEFKVDSLLKQIFHGGKIIYLPAKTGGNAETILYAENEVEKKSPVCISGNNYILRYDERKLSHLFENEKVDVIILTFTHHECVLRNPYKYAYVLVDNNKALFISEKEQISPHPYRDHAVTGTVIYRQASDLFESIKEMLLELKEKKSYFTTAINKLIEKGKNVVVFEVDKFISLNSPLDYQEFVYWQDYFDSLPYHPYSKMVH